MHLLLKNGIFTNYEALSMWDYKPGRGGGLAIIVNTVARCTGVDVTHSA